VNNMGFLDKVKDAAGKVADAAKDAANKAKVAAKAAYNKGQMDDKLAKKIYDLISGLDGNSGIEFKERSRIKTDSDENEAGEEITEVKIKNEKWKAKVKTADGTMKLEIEDVGGGKLDVKGKIKKEPPIKKKMDVIVKDYTLIDEKGEVAFKDLDGLKKKVEAAFK
jgi:hypothetical protein